VINVPHFGGAAPAVFDVTFASAFVSVAVLGSSGLAVSAAGVVVWVAACATGGGVGAGVWPAI
jgi:hypothetical protein